MRAGYIGGRSKRIERLSRRQSLSYGKGIGGIKRIIAEIAEEGAVRIIAAGFGDDVDRCTAGAAEVGSVITAVDLKFLHSVLAHVEAHAAGIIVDFAAVNGNAVAAAIAAIEGKTALGRL